ncbi:hypothetical protein QN397_06770 [Variovorax sp. RTB1]|nr:hypothetical protein [Variovorax sp. RTB1]
MNSDPLPFASMLAEDVAPEDKDWYHVKFFYVDSVLGAEGYSILLDWCAADLDGAPLELLALGSAIGRPYELEIRRLDQQPIIELPSVEKWRSR